MLRYLTVLSRGSSESPRRALLVELPVINAQRKHLTSFSSFVTSWLQSFFRCLWSRWDSNSPRCWKLRLHSILCIATDGHATAIYIFESRRGAETANCDFYRISRLSVRETWCLAENRGSLEFLQFSTCVVHDNVHDQKFYKHLIYSLELPVHLCADAVLSSTRTTHTSTESQCFSLASRRGTRDPLE